MANVVARQTKILPAHVTATQATLDNSGQGLVYCRYLADMAIHLLQQTSLDSLLNPVDLEQWAKHPAAQVSQSHTQPLVLAVDFLPAHRIVMHWPAWQDTTHSASPLLVELATPQIPAYAQTTIWRPILASCCFL